MELVLTKTPSGALAPADEATVEELAKVKTGAVVHGRFTKMRNYKFLQKFMLLIRAGFDAWEETAPPRYYKGETITPNIEEFRSNVTILAGYHEATFDIYGNVHLRAKSIAFANMDEATFERLFSQVLNILLTKVLTNPAITEESLRKHVDRIMSFDR